MRETPPETPCEPTTETLHGEEIADPYRWLEADDDERVREWTDAQNEYADAVLDTDTRDALRPRFEDVARVTDYGPVTVAGDRYFRTIEAPHEDHAVLHVQESLDGEPRVLVDPNGFAGEAASMNWFVVGPDGERVAYGYDEGGTEQYDLRVVDAATGEEREEVPNVGRTNPGGFAWTDKGFYSVRTGTAGEADSEGGGQLDRALYYHEHGADPADDRLVTDDFGPRELPVLTTDDGDALFVAVSQGWDTTDLYRADESRADPLVPLVTGLDASIDATAGEDTLYLRTDHEADRGRVVAVPLAEARTGDDLALADYPDAVPETEGVLQGVTTVGDALAAVHLHDASAELTLWRDGERTATVPTPDLCTVPAAALDVDDDGTDLFHVVQGFAEPARVRRYDVAEGTATAIAQADADLDVDVTVERTFHESADGTEVPAFVVRAADADPDGDAPAVIYGYGGFRIALTPSFRRFAGPFLDAGGVFVVACLRGGSEYGESWHRAGMFGDKQNVFDDLYAVAEGIGDEYADPDRIGVWGGSNGGLLTGAALTQRPDLWAAVLCEVPLLDMLRFHRFLLGASWTSEYGSPDDPEAFEYLREYSPYHNVAERAYPPTLFTTALGDTRVHPAHARKTTARVQANQTGEGPILLRTETDTGHGVGKPTERIVREQVDRWTWLCDRLGVPVGAGDGD
ncbi:prolyl oligopeptidase family serine peptidase [Halosegnis marinus]|uniref:prolyl oligopeptidase n=1 Tax=Halosegnis marinus TaxID=3034023 RepID=A0ABD5ZK64_9EURY|nr:prolyl oligopeptidase family serine peptidase [Halosegnis sp. DT85]